jgi:hypothetical protein
MVGAVVTTIPFFRWESHQRATSAAVKVFEEL